MTAAPDAQAVLTVDLGALAANWRWLAAQASGAECAAAVKADAYGMGIAQAVPALATAGCQTFFVAHLSEGARARAALRDAGVSDRSVRIFALHGFHPAQDDPAALERWRLQPVIGSPAELRAWLAASPTLRAGGAALHVDTGMNRLGLDPEEAATLDNDTIAAAGLTLLMSHFVAAEEDAHPLTARQIATFETLRRGPLGALPASLANSSGMLLPQRPHYDLVRPGYALYGGNPLPGRPNPMRPVVTLDARVLRTRTIEAGETAGYGALWRAARRTRIAAIGVGYADGLPRNARSVGETGGPVALVNEVRCPLVGRVSMDLSLIDVTDAGAVEAGATVQLLGAAIGVDELGVACGTIGYEVLTRLGGRYTRRYVSTA